MKRLLRKLAATKASLAMEVIDRLDGYIDGVAQEINERGKRAVERHWLFRSAGNYVQKHRPKGERKYSYVTPRYQATKGYVYFRWVRFHFRQKKGGGRGRLLTPILQSGKYGYDLRKLKTGATDWERGAMKKTEHYLTKIREANRLVIEARFAIEKMANAVADLDHLDREHYEGMKEEIMSLGFSEEEFEKIQASHLGIMKRAQEEGTDMLPLTDSPYYRSERMEKKFPEPRSRSVEEDLPEITGPGEEDWAPLVDQDVNVDVDEKETEPVEPNHEEEAPDPIAMDKLYRPWLYEDE